MPLLTINPKENEPEGYADRKTAKAIIVNEKGEVFSFPSNLIGGGLEGDESYEEALHREALEEAGIKIEIQKYLRDKFGNKCCLCGWAEVNPVTKIIPLVADHIDGNWRNNAEENLRLICPNCDSLTPTYSALNKGNGRGNRAISKRIIEARLFVKNK